MTRDRRVKDDPHIPQWEERRGRHPDALREAAQFAIDQLEVIIEAVEIGGDIPTEATIAQNRLRAAVRAATEERLHHHTIDGITYWFDADGRIVGGPA